MSEVESRNEETSEQWRELGVPSELWPELLSYTENPYRGLPRQALSLPLEDEPHVEAWREYSEEAEEKGAATVLRKRLPQLWFPIREGVGQEKAYRAAVLQGATPWPLPSGIELRDPDGIELEVHGTVAGAVPIVTTTDRVDFVTLVRAFTARNEPVGVSDSMGACLVQGLVNQDRVRRHRAAWSDGKVPEGAASWPEEFKRMALRKELYQDRVLLLSRGYYSAVRPEDLDADESSWLADSLRIRREHECFHYLTLRLAGSIRNHLLDELVADLAGLLATHQGYRADTALLLLGLDRAAAVRPGARLLNYRGDPPLSDRASDALHRLVVQAISNLAVVIDARPDLVSPEIRPYTLLAVAGLGIPGLAGANLLERLSMRMKARRGAAPSSSPRGA